MTGPSGTTDPAYEAWGDMDEAERRRWWGIAVAATADAVEEAERLRKECDELRKERDELRRLCAGYASDADLYADLYKAGWTDPAHLEPRPKGNQS